MEKEIRVYQTEDGKTPFNDWLFSIKQEKAKIAVLNRLGRLRQGNLGYWKRIESIFELKIDIGPGYRVYFGEHNKTIVVLLVGGTKKKQNKDIQLAKDYWIDFKRRFS